MWGGGCRGKGVGVGFQGKQHVFTSRPRGLRPPVALKGRGQERWSVQWRAAKDTYHGFSKPYQKEELWTGRNKSMEVPRWKWTGTPGH